MDSWIYIEKDKSHLNKEKEKARKLKKTAWWQTKLSQGLCHYCHQTFSPSELTMDHIVPLSRHGKSTKGNVVPCCLNCNQTKKFLTPVEQILNNC